jgi:(1->4)-alpha-D-glucan 1-alpha-D-glucosylmutase
LVSLNEVGGYPQQFGTTVHEFHHQNVKRRKEMSHSMLSTSTHDSKRSEDVRARINVLSEIPREWRSALLRWNRLNRKYKITLNREVVPDRNEECLLYQTLLGTYPLATMDKKEHAEYLERIRGYMLKALREAKVHTSWISPNVTYEEGLRQFISSILDPSPSNGFLADFAVLNGQIACCGMYNSLSQALLRTFSPGVPDLYQGNELWDFSLVDPDNRRPVDFVNRIRLLNALKKETAKRQSITRLARRLMNSRENGQIKLYVIWTALCHRRSKPSLFDDGTYLPLEASGSASGHICAFAWQKDHSRLVVVAPRLVAGLTRNATIPPVGRRAWGDSQLLLPQGYHGQQYRNIFTDEIVGTGRNARRPTLPLARIFATFPVAALASLQK